MNEYQRAAEVLTKEATRTRDLMEAAEALGKAGSLKQTVEETEASIAQLKKDEAAAKKAVADAEGATAKALKQATATLEKARADAEQIVSDGTNKAHAILEKAQSDAKAKSIELGGKVAALTAEIASLEKRRADADAATKAAEETLAEVQRKRKALAASLA